MSSCYDVIIVGAGCAGLTASQYAARANLKTLVLESQAAGGQALLIADLENYPGFDLPISGFEFSRQMEQQALNFGAKIASDEIIRLKKDEQGFLLDGENDSYRCKSVILATGAQHRTLGIPGEQQFINLGVSYCASCDGPFFKGGRILAIGGGDAACDEARFLAKLTDKVVLIHRRDKFRAQPALLSRVRADQNIDVRTPYVALAINGKEKVTSVELQNVATGEIVSEGFDAVFIFVGSLPNNGLAKELVQLDSGGFIVTDHKMQSSLPGLFAIGDVRATVFRQLVVGAGEGAIAAHSAAQYIEELD